jgi:hypothetical protein
LFCVQAEHTKASFAELTACAALTRPARSRVVAITGATAGSATAIPVKATGQFLAHDYRLQSCGLTDPGANRHDPFTMFFSLV